MDRVIIKFLRDEQQCQIGEVLSATGTEVKVGQRILYNKRYATPFRMSGEPVAFLPEDYILKLLSDAEKPFTKKELILRFLKLRATTAGMPFLRSKTASLRRTL